MIKIQYPFLRRQTKSKIGHLKLEISHSRQRRAGISLFEILIVLSVFALLAAASTQTIFLTLRGARKSDALGKVRENLGYALSVVERQLHNATYISECPNPDTSIITYEDQEGVTANFSCEDIGVSGYIASNSARLTAEEIEVTSCIFTCEPAVGSIPPAIGVELKAIDPNAKAIEGASVTVSTKVYLRTY